VPAHHLGRAPVESVAGAPGSRRAGDAGILPAHLRRRRAGENSWHGLGRFGPGPGNAAGAPAQERAGGNLLLPARSWAGAPAVFPGPGPEQL
jgi:hypothetical protein